MLCGVKKAKKIVKKKFDIFFENIFFFEIGSQQKFSGFLGGDLTLTEKSENNFTFILGPPCNIIPVSFSKFEKHVISTHPNVHTLYTHNLTVFS